MLKLFNKIWQYDFRHLGEGQLRLARHVGVVAVVCLVFGAFDLMFDTGAGFFGDVMRWIEKDNPFQHWLSGYSFKLVAYGVLGFMFVYIAGLALLSYRASLRKYGQQRFAGIFWSHFLSNMVAMAFTFLFFAVLGGIAYSLGYNYNHGAGFIAANLTIFEKWIGAHIPTLVRVPYPFALLAAAVLAALPGYFVHWLCHHSRLMWYVSHRCHHTAEIMHPAGIGPFQFLPEIFSAIPAVLITAAASKLFHYEPMLKEAAILAFFGILTEKFNHTSAFYEFAYRNPLLRHVSHYYGNGVYHYMHHTSKPGDEIVNVGGTPFLIWDRVFGTYRTPTPQAPRVGLTNNPTIALNPFKIVFSGIQQIGYELRHNSGWHRFWVLFGTVYYTPPLTKDFLILGYPQKEGVTVDHVEVIIATAPIETLA